MFVLRCDQIEVLPKLSYFTRARVHARYAQAILNSYSGAKKEKENKKVRRDRMSFNVHNTIDSLIFSYIQLWKVLFFTQHRLENNSVKW